MQRIGDIIAGDYSTLRDVYTRSVSCPTCGSPEISSPYRDEGVVYLACGKCQTVWPVEPKPADTAHDASSGRSRIVRSPFDE